MTRDRSLPIRAKGKDRARLRAAIRPHGKEAEERKAKETGHSVTTPRLALTVCWMAFIF